MHINIEKTISGNNDRIIINSKEMQKPSLNCTQLTFFFNSKNKTKIEKNRFWLLHHTVEYRPVQDR